MTKKELWRKFMKTGSVADYLEYSRARDDSGAPNYYDEDVSNEFAEEFINNFDSDFPEMEQIHTEVDKEEYFDYDNKD